MNNIDRLIEESINKSKNREPAKTYVDKIRDELRSVGRDVRNEVVDFEKNYNYSKGLIDLAGTVSSVVKGETSYKDLTKDKNIYNLVNPKENTNKLTGMAGDALFGGLRASTEAIMSPVTPAISDLIQSGVENTGGEQGWLSQTMKGFEWTTKKVGGVYGDSIGMKSDYSKEGLGELVVGGAMSTAGYLGGKLALKGVKSGTFKTIEVADKLMKKYSKAETDGYTDKTSTELIKTDVVTPEKIDDTPKLLNESVKEEIDTNISGLDSYTKALKELREAKNKNDTSMDTALVILSKNGLDSVADSIKKEELNIQNNELITDRVIKLETNKDYDSTDIIQNTEKISNITDLIDEGVLEYNGVNKDGYSFLYTAEAKKQLFKKDKADELKGYTMDIDTFNKVTGKTPDSLAKTNPIDRALNKIEGKDRDVQGANNAIDRILENKGDKTAEYDLISYLNRVNDRYKLGLDKDIEKIYNPSTGRVDMPEAQKVIKEVNNRKEEFFFGDTNYLAREFKSIEDKLRIESKIIDIAFKAGTKKGAKETKAQLEKKIEDNKIDYKDKLNKVKENFKKKEADLKEKIKTAKGKVADKYKNRLEAERLKHKEKIENMKAAHNTKIDELKAEIEGRRFAVQYIETKLKAVLNNKGFYGDKAKLNKVIIAAFKAINSKQKISKKRLEEITTKLKYRLINSHKKGLVKKIKESAKIIKGFSKNIDSVKRKKYDAALIFQQQYAHLFKSAAMYTNEGLPLDVLEKLNFVLDNIKKEAAMVSKVRAANTSSFIKSTIDRINYQANGKKFYLFGDREQGIQNLSPKKTFKDRAMQFNRLWNYPLYWAQSVRKIFGRDNKEAMKTFFHAPMRAYNFYLGKYEVLNIKAAEYQKVFEEVGGKSGAELVRKKLGYLAGILRRNDYKGDKVWIGAEKFVAMMRTGEGKLKDEWKLDNKESKFLSNQPKPKILAEMPDEIWNMLKGTKGHQFILEMTDNTKLMDVYYSIIADNKNIGNDLAEVAMNEENIYLGVEDSYITFMKHTQGADIVQDMETKKGFSTINDSMIRILNRDKRLQGGDKYELDILKMYTMGGRNALYYTAMKPIHNLVNNVYYGRNILSDEIETVFKDNGIKLKGTDIKALSDKNITKLEKAGYKIIMSTDGEVSGIRKKDGIVANTGEVADRRMQDIITRIANGGIKIDSKDYWAYSANQIATGAALSMKVSPVIKQTLSYGDAFSELSLSDLNYGIFNYKSKVVIDGKTMTVGERILDVSPELKNRMAENVSRDIRNSSNITFGGFIPAWKKTIELGMKPMAYVDREIATQIWLGSYRKHMKKKKPGISDEEIYLINDMEAISEANYDMVSIMSTSDDLFTSPMMGSVFGKVFFALTGTQQNRFGKFVVQFDEVYTNNGLMPAILQTSRFTAMNITEALMTYWLAKLYFEIGLSTFDIEKNSEDSNMFYELLAANIRNTPGISILQSGMESDAFAQLPFLSLAITATEGTGDILDSASNLEGDKTIEGFGKLLTKLGLGDVGKGIRSLGQ